MRILKQALLAAVAIGAAATPAHAELVYGLVGGDRLIAFDSAAPGATLYDSTITGASDLVGIDFRPATGQLFGIGANNQLYTLGGLGLGGSATATAVGTPFAPPGGAGASVGFDFNPTVDRIRIVDANDNNYRAVPDTGALAATDGDLAYAAGDENAGFNPDVGTAAYTNSVAGATTTTLYVLDANLDVLATQGSAAGATPAVSPNTGQLLTVAEVTVNGLLLDLSSVGGFDISGATGLALFTTATSLYSLDLGTGVATLVGAFDDVVNMRGLAIGGILGDPGEVPEPAALALLGMGVLGVAAARLRRRAR